MLDTNALFDKVSQCVTDSKHISHRFPIKTTTNKRHNKLLKKNPLFIFLSRKREKKGSLLQNVGVGKKKGKTKLDYNIKTAV